MITWKIYEVTAAGFDGSTIETDHKVLWVKAESIEDVNRAVAGLYAQVQEIEDLTLLYRQNPPGLVGVDYELPKDHGALREFARAELWKEKAKRLQLLRDAWGLTFADAQAFFHEIQKAEDPDVDAFIQAAEKSIRRRALLRLMTTPPSAAATKAHTEPPGCGVPNDDAGVEPPEGES